MKKNIKNNLTGIVFLIWFIGSIFLMFYVSKINEYYSIMMFGQYFLVFGLIPLKGSYGIEKLICVPFILVGLCSIIIPYLIMNPDVLSVSLNWDNIIGLLLILAFVIAGFAMIFIPLVVSNKLKKRCTVTVNAKIKSYNYIYNGKGTKTYCPIYEFEFNNNIYNVTSNKYSNFGNEKVDIIVNLKINPNNPNEFLDNRRFNMFVVKLGFVFLTISIPIFIYMVTKYSIVN